MILNGVIKIVMLVMNLCSLVSVVNDQCFLYSSLRLFNIIY
jgi:hypothetical protein